MILKFPKCFKLHRYNYLFPIDIVNAQEYKTWLSNRYKPYLYNHSTYLSNNTFENIVKDFGSLVLDNHLWNSYKLRYKYSTNGFIFGDILYFENMVVVYFDAENHKMIINNNLTDEQKDIIINMIYVKNASAYTYNMTYEYSNDLYVESVVILKRTWDYNRTISKLFTATYNSARNVLLENNTLTFHRIPIANEDLFKSTVKQIGYSDYKPIDIKKVSNDTLYNIETLEGLIQINSDDIFEDNAETDEEEDDSFYEEDEGEELDEEELEEDLIAEPAPGLHSNTIHLDLSSDNYHYIDPADFTFSTTTTSTTST